jgi:acetolactate synthase-1/2/3 large subunit
VTKRTGGEIVRDRLLAEKVPYLIGIPGHGIVAMLDAFRTSQDRIKVLQVRHEQSAVHLANGYYRVSGKPLAVFTSIGPGALNTAVGLGASYVDWICQNSELWGKLMSKRVRQMFDFVLNRSTFSTDLVAKNEDEL